MSEEIVGEVTWAERYYRGGWVQRACIKGTLWELNVEGLSEPIAVGSWVRIVPTASGSCIKVEPR